MASVHSRDRPSIMPAERSPRSSLLLAVMLAGIAYVVIARVRASARPRRTSPAMQSILSQLVAAVIGKGILVLHHDRLGAPRCLPCPPIRASPTSPGFAA